VISEVARPKVDLEVVVPAFNEEARIGGTLQDIAQELTKVHWTSGIVVVDNGSTDRTSEVADRARELLPIRVIGCSQRGKGAAVRRGILTSRARWVGFCDADSSTPAYMIPRVVDLLASGHRIVVGSRYCGGGRTLVRQPLVRRVGSLGFRSLSRGMVGDISDTQCGFKFFEAALARQLFMCSRLSGFAFDLELLSLAHQANVPITEIPVDWSEHGGSSFRCIRDGTRAYGELISLRLLSAARGDPLVLRPGILDRIAMDQEPMLVRASTTV
jgi:glycosyltransferase involved in cell wall biosynthesis